MSTGNRYSEEIKEEARELRNQGLSYKQIADKYGITKSTAHYWCNNINYTSDNKAQLDHLIEQIIIDPLYDIREDGTIWTLKDKTGKLVTDTWRRCDKNIDYGYKAVKYSGKDIRVHRIIYRKFKGQLNSNLEINHIDCDKQNNTPENLELVTQQENIEHAKKLGLLKTVINETDVVTIIKMFIDDNKTKSDISRILGINRDIVSNVCLGRSWKHVKV